VADGEPLLRPRRSLGSGCKGLAERCDVARDLLQAGRQRLDVGALRRTEHALEPDVEPVHRVLDALESLGDRAQAPGEPLDVGGRGDSKGAHRHLLRLHRLLARLEGAAERGRQHRVARQLLRDLAQGLLALARDALAEPLVAALVGHRAGAYRTPSERRPFWADAQPVVEGYPGPAAVPPRTFEEASVKPLLRTN